MEASQYCDNDNKNNKNNRKKRRLETNSAENENNEPTKKKRKINNQNEEKEKHALFDKIAQNPEFGHIKTQIENGDDDLLAMLLDDPNMLDEMIKLKSIFGELSEIENQFGAPKNTKQEQDPNIIQLQKAKSINEKWFKSNKPIDIIKQTRNEFQCEAT
eukprot:230246_1